jgi:hypothetical protein
MENQEHLLKTIGPMYVDFLKSKNLKVVDDSGNVVAELPTS